MITFRSDPKEAPLASRRTGWRSIFIGLAVALVVVVAAGFLNARSFDGGSTPPALATSARIPVTLPDGRRALLRDLIRPGVPTVINLWASWCGPCRSEAPYLAELRRRYGREQLNLVHLNVRDSDSSRQDRADFLIAAGLPPEYAVLADTQIAELTNATDNLVPRTIVFDKAGVPIATITGFKPMALARISGLVSR
jgi:thiol-disulfide isomerase/thioredoxin